MLLYVRFRCVPITVPASSSLLRERCARTHCCVCRYAGTAAVYLTSKYSVFVLFSGLVCFFPSRIIRARLLTMDKTGYRVRNTTTCFSILFMFPPKHNTKEHLFWNSTSPRPSRMPDVSNLQRANLVPYRCRVGLTNLLAAPPLWKRLDQSDANVRGGGESARCGADHRHGQPQTGGRFGQQPDRHSEQCNISCLCPGACFFLFWLLLGFWRELICLGFALSCAVSPCLSLPCFQLRLWSSHLGDILSTCLVRACLAFAHLGTRTR